MSTAAPLTTRDELVRILREILDVDADRITDDARLEEDLGIDSIDVTEITLDIAERLDVDVPDDEFLRVPTFADLVRVVDALRAGPTT